MANEENRYRYDAATGTYVPDPTGDKVAVRSPGGGTGYVTVNPQTGYQDATTMGTKHVSAFGTGYSTPSGSYTSEPNEWSKPRSTPSQDTALGQGEVVNGQYYSTYGQGGTGGSSLPSPISRGMPSMNMQPDSSQYGNFGNIQGANPWGMLGSMGSNGLSALANQLMQYTGYYPTNYLNQSGDQSNNVLLLNSLLSGMGQGVPNNYGGAGMGLPNYFGNGYGMGIGAYTQGIDQAQLAPYLGGLESFGGLGGSFAQRLDSLYNPFAAKNIPNMYADYLEFMAPRYSQGWNLYGASPALEGLMAMPNQNPYQGGQLFSQYGGQGSGVWPWTSSSPSIPNVMQKGMYDFGTMTG